MSDLTEIHKRMVRNVFLNTEILLNEGEKNIFEYDIQAFMFLFFRAYLRSFDCWAGREKEGKVDCVIYNKNDSPIIFYEIKTYFKEHESIKVEHFQNDIEKLAKLVKKIPVQEGIFLRRG